MIIGNEYIYMDRLAEERYEVQLVGIDEPDDMGLVFVYFRAIDDNGSKNDKYHPVYGKYWLILEANDPSILSLDDVDNMMNNVDNFMSYYKKRI